MHAREHAREHACLVWTGFYHYFRFRFITVLACISVSITVIVNGFDLFQLTDISVSVNWNNTALFHGMCQHDHCDLLLHCHYVFLIWKPEWQSPNHFHLLPRVFGINSQVIFHPFPLFPLSRRDLSTIFFWVPFPVIPHHPLASRFVMSAHPQMRLRSDTPHCLADTFQLSTYD